MRNPEQYSSYAKQVPYTQKILNGTLVFIVDTIKNLRPSMAFMVACWCIQGDQRGKIKCYSWRKYE